jgi:hypothetical protein
VSQHLARAVANSLSVTSLSRVLLSVESKNCSIYLRWIEKCVCAGQKLREHKEQKKKEWRGVVERA